MLTTLRTVQLFTRFLTHLHRKGQLTHSVINEVVSLSDAIQQITEQDDPAELLQIVSLMAQLGPDVLTVLPAAPPAPLYHHAAQINDLLMLFNRFLRGSKLTSRHLEQFVAMEREVLIISDHWTSQEIIEIVRIISVHRCATVRIQIAATASPGV